MRRSRTRNLGSTRNARERGNPYKFRGYGIAAFWRSDLGVTLNGTDVSALADQGGAGVDMSQGTASNQPAYVLGVANGQPCIRFTAANQKRLSRVNVDLFGSAAYSVFACWKLRSATVDQAIYGNRAAAAGGFALGTIGGGTSRNVNHSGVATHVDAVMQTTTHEIWAVRRAAATAPTLAVDGVNQALGNSGTGGMTAAGASAELTIGALFQSPHSNHADVDWYETVNFTMDVGVSVTVRIQHYMGARYAIAA